MDVIGMIPGVGEIADELNAAIYLAQGDLANAAMRALSLVPIAGVAAAVAKSDVIVRFWGKNIDAVMKAGRKAV